jgi:hypothetical protein
VVERLRNVAIKVPLLWKLAQAKRFLQVRIK